MEEDMKEGQKTVGCQQRVACGKRSFLFGFGGEGDLKAREREKKTHKGRTRAVEKTRGSSDPATLIYSSCPAANSSLPPMPSLFASPSPSFFTTPTFSLFLIPSGPNSAPSAFTSLSSHWSAETPPCVASACRTARRPRRSIWRKEPRRRVCRDRIGQIDVRREEGWRVKDGCANEPALQKRRSRFRQRGTCWIGQRPILRVGASLRWSGQTKRNR